MSEGVEMNGINVDFELKNYGEEVKKQLEEAIIAGLYEAAGEIQAEVTIKSPSDQSNLRNSWQYKVYESELKAEIGSPLENAIWNEFGTGEYALHGDGRKSAWYVPVDGDKGKKKPTFNGSVVIVHGKDGKKFYKTNGKAPKRTLQKAFIQKRNVVEKLIMDKIRKVLG